MKTIQLLMLALPFLFLSHYSFSWHDQTHIGIGKAAGFEKSSYLSAPDIAKLKAGDIESFNHWYNADSNEIITTQLLKKQIHKYNQTGKNNSKGHLYGAIIASIRNYQKESYKGKYGFYHLIYTGHYIGDLSMPFHNIEHKGFSKERHTYNDGIIEDLILNDLDRIKVYPIEILSEENLINEIVRIAQLTKELGYQLQNEKRDLTQEEAFNQISHSASLFKAVLNYLKIGKPNE